MLPVLDYRSVVGVVFQGSWFHPQLLSPPCWVLIQNFLLHRKWPLLAASSCLCLHPTYIMLKTQRLFWSWTMSIPFGPSSWCSINTSLLKIIGLPLNSSGVHSTRQKAHSQVFLRQTPVCLVLKVRVLRNNTLQILGKFLSSSNSTLVQF